ncbi:MAG: DUF262 domain-containing protein, partial [Desulfomonilaceae bacterium]
MAGSSFKTNPVDLHDLLKNCDSGVLQLPDFQRSWVWDEDRIKSLLASVSRGFPIGVLMTLSSGGEMNFKPRPIEGTPVEAKQTSPRSLILDGQQRMTSLYQATLRGKVVETVTARKKKVKRWFYFDINKSLDPSLDLEDAIVGVPEDRIMRKDFGREIDLDLSSLEQEYRFCMFPVSRVFDWDTWQDGFYDRWGDEGNDWKRKFRDFKNKILKNFDKYLVPVIELDQSTSKEAVCTVFEKVNTGGVPLDAFELITAMYAAKGHELRKDWRGDDVEIGRHRRLAEALRHGGADSGILANVSSTDFLQAISLFHTRGLRRAAKDAGKQGTELPQVTGNRRALLNLPLEAYKQYEQKVELGFVTAAKFLTTLHIYRIFDLPYQSQIVPLAAILADIGDAWEYDANRKKLERWYWNGVFGELYGSAVDTRIARDFIEVPKWLKGGIEPSTVSETMFRADRLKTMRMRLSAAYKGVNALLMKEGAKDFRSGQEFDLATFFGENVDIHHIFPQDFCKKQAIKPEVFDSIINKTPLSYRTNRMLGGSAPSEYLKKLEEGDEKTPSIAVETLDLYLRSHLIDPLFLRSDKFDDFMKDRQDQLQKLIEHAIGSTAYTGKDKE